MGSGSQGFQSGSLDRTRFQRLGSIPVHFFEREPHVHWTEVSLFLVLLVTLDIQCFTTWLLSAAKLPAQTRLLLKQKEAPTNSHIHSLATAELTIVIAYIFRKYKLSLPKDFVNPDKIDRFTLNYMDPGAPVNFELRR